MARFAGARWHKKEKKIPEVVTYTIIMPDGTEMVASAERGADLTDEDWARAVDDGAEHWTWRYLGEGSDGRAELAAALTELRIALADPAQIAKEGARIQRVLDSPKLAEALASSDPELQQIAQTMRARLTVMLTGLA